MTFEFWMGYLFGMATLLWIALGVGCFKLWQTNRRARQHHIND